MVINYGEGGGLQNGKIAGPKPFVPPPPQDSVKLFVPPPLKHPSFNITSSYQIKTTPKPFMPPPPFSMAKTFSAPPFHRGKTAHAPPPSPAVL